MDGLLLFLVSVIPFAAAFGHTLFDQIRKGRGLGEIGRLDLARNGGRFLTYALVTSIVGSVYEITLTHFKGQTVGKMAFRIKVVQIEDGALPAWDRSMLRWAVPEAAGWLPLLGGLLQLLVYLWMLWDPRRQGLHDKAARTVVIRAA